MAITEIYSNKNAIRVCGNNTYYKKFFIADSLADVDLMNTHGKGFLRHPAGTAVLCAENSTVYVLTRDDNPYGEVNDEENAEFIPMRGGVTPEDVTEAIVTALADYYDREEVDGIVAAKQNVPTVVSQTAPTAITLTDNTEYELTEVADLTISFPTGRFISTIHITTTDTGFQTVAFPATEKHVGEFPDIQAAQEWIISVQDGIIVAAEVKQSDTVA